MNLERANERARSVPGPKNAARLYNDIEYELALGEPDDRLETAGEQALATLEDRFPGIREEAREIEEPPSVSRRAGDTLHGVRQQRPRRRGSPRRPKRHRRTQPGRSWSLLCAHARSHPVYAVVVMAFFIIVIVNLGAYIVLGMIACAALKTYRQR